MIGTFKDNKLEKFWEQKASKHFDPTIEEPILQILNLLKKSNTIDELNIKDVHKLAKGSGKIHKLIGKFSIKVNAKSRICFNWDTANGIANDIEFIKDYH